MNRSGFCAAWFAASLLAGCASAPPTVDPQAAAQPSAEEAATLTDEQLMPSLVVDGHQANPGSEVTCREMLQHASNTIVTRCMSADAWKRYQQMEAQRAQAILRSWQGSPYAGF